MVTMPAAIPPMTIDVSVGLERDRGEVRISVLARNDACGNCLVILDMRTTQRLIGDLQAILARAEQGDAHG